MKIANLTQHSATPEQIAAGVFNLGKEANLSDLLNFDELPDMAEIEKRADLLARTARLTGATHAMIGGALFLMPKLEHALRANGVQPVYAFSKRESVETHNGDGTVSKKNVFKHIGFVAA